MTRSAEVKVPKQYFELSQRKVNPWLPYLKLTSVNLQSKYMPAPSFPACQYKNADNVMNPQRRRDAIVKPWVLCGLHIHVF